MIRSARRTWIALVLVTAAVGLPSLAWYLASSGELRRESDRLVARAETEAGDRARRLSASLTARLEAIRRKESARPFYHYQNLYHDPEGAYDGPSIIPSPLAAGPQDGMVRAHFQFNPEGSVELPTWNPDVPERNAGGSSDDERELLQALLACGPSCDPPGATAWFGVAGDGVGIEPATLGPPDGGAGRGGWRRLVLDEAAWIQNKNASALYVDLMGWDGDPRCEVLDAAERAQRSGARVTIDVGPFQWRTVPMGDRPALVAIRAVRTPDGTYSQGFVVDGDRVADWLERSGAGASFGPAGTVGATEAVLPIHGTEWAVAVDPRPLADGARAVAAGNVVDFRTRFALAVGVAWLVGLAVVGLVWQAERVAQQRSRFAASAAHELRTPLAGLRMYGEMLADGLGDPARSRDYARRIATESERLGRVVSNVLGFARLERGMLDVRCERGDLATAVLECTRDQRAALESAGVTLRTDFPAGLPHAVFDRDALCHVLQNLLDNAEKYTRGHDDRTVTVAIEPGGGGLRVAVLDRGPGVAPGDRGRLFRPFARGSRRDVPAGLGLGLVLSRALARSMGGDLVHEDRPGGGSRFVLNLAA